jgi:hypothetical protein
VAHASRQLEGVKKSKQLIRRLTDKGAKKHEGEVVAFLCELCVLCGFARNWLQNNPVKRGWVKEPGGWPWSSWTHHLLQNASRLAMDRVP